MAQLAILAAIQVGLAVTSYYLTPKSKLPPLDKGRLDDLRFQTAEEGAMLPRPYGKRVRMAGNIFDGSRTQEFKTTTPGRSGGKGGGGRPAEPTVTNFTYKKTFGIAFCEGPIRSVLSIKEDDEVVYNLAPPGIGSSYYEAEASGNTLAGGAAIAVDTTCSGGKKVTVPNTGSVLWNTVPINVAGTVNLVIYYQSTASISATVRINNTTDYVITLPSTSGALGSYALDVTMTLGNNTVKITNGTASTLSLDQIFAFADIVDDVTGVIHPSLIYPTDLNNPRPFYDFAPYRNVRGEITGTFANGGQSPFELYLGTEDQLQSPTLVALHGAANTPAHRGVAYLVANQYTLKDGRLGNFTAEIEPDIQDLADALTDMFLNRGADAAELDFTAMAGTTITEGFVVDRRAPLSDYIDPLQIWYNFDLVPTGGKIKAVKRGGASAVSIAEAKLAAHEEGEERPQGAVAIDHQEETDIPGSVDVIYLDVAETKEFHTAAQHVVRQVGNSLDPETLNFPIVSDKDTAHAVGKRWLYEQVLKSKLLEFSTGPEYRYLIPTDVVTLPLTDRTWVARLVSRQAGFNGLVKWKAIPEKAAVYTQTGSGQVGSGSEIPPVAFPPNTFLALMDLPPLRLEDDALGYYVAACPRGQAASVTGKWQGAHLYKEELTGIYDRITGFDRAATIGILRSAVSAVTDTLPIDTTNSVILDCYHDDGLIASITEEQMLSRPVNEIVIGSGAGAEVLRFRTATPLATASGFVASYQLSNLLHGLNGTEAAALAGHSSGKTIVFLNDEVKFRKEDPAELRRVRNFKAVSVGQAQANAPVTSFTLQGYSKKPLSVTGITGYRSSVTNDAIVAWSRRTRVAGSMTPQTGVPVAEENELYLFEVLNAGSPVYSLWVDRALAVPLPWRTIATADIGQKDILRSDVRLDPFDSFLEGTLDPQDMFPEPEIGWSAINLYSSDFGKLYWQLQAFHDTSVPETFFSIHELGVQKYGISLASGSAVRPAIRIINGTAFFYINFVNETSIPVYQSNLSVADIGPIAIGAGYTSNGTDVSTVTDVFLRDKKCRAVVSAALQTALFGSLKPLGTLSVRITQYSTLVGPGTSVTALV